MEGLYIDTIGTGGDDEKASHDYLLEAQQAATPVDWKMDNGLSGTLTAYYGTAIISDLEATFGSGDELAGFSATFDGSGGISTTDTHPPA